MRSMWASIHNQSYSTTEISKKRELYVRKDLGLTRPWWASTINSQLERNPQRKQRSNEDGGEKSGKVSGHRYQREKTRWLRTEWSIVLQGKGNIRIGKTSARFSTWRPMVNSVGAISLEWWDLNKLISEREVKTWRQWVKIIFLRYYSDETPRKPFSHYNYCIP